MFLISELVNCPALCIPLLKRRDPAMCCVQAKVPVPDPPPLWPRIGVGWGQGGSPKCLLEFGLSLPLSKGTKQGI